ncbi:TetR/AcrR family transcriptional regulator [Lactiplantibacillus dongliensis]|uniref:TetR/AcrR family transcriptional regulator n=1 Tax=Lactiplantibacillus dongliensis TaxID=2559919 RepID=A0ABW1R488_9LACO|nr:TetR/AcrR family transcriptional regulator [Lactiplantibacillus dongliensis]
MQVNSVETLFKKTLANSKLSAKQQAVLQVSLTLFAEQGFDRTSTSEIAKAAGVSEGTVFKQFKTKEGILQAIVNPVLAHVVPMVATEFLDELKTNDLNDLETFLQYAIQDRMMFAVENRLQIKVFAQEMSRNPNIVATLSAKLEAMVAGELGTALQRFKDRGELVDWPNMRIVRYLVGTVASYVLPQIFFAPTADFDAAQASRDALDFLMHGLAPAK